MKVPRRTPRWRERLAKMDPGFDEIRLPQIDGAAPEQDAEWADVVIGGEVRRIRFHDYGEVYAIPGLYESLFYERLKCCSPSRVVGLLEQVATEFDLDLSTLRVLDVGAGNGMVGDELERLDVEKIVGVDIIPEGEQTTARDRPGVYADYLTTDLCELPEADEKRLRRHKLNCLTVVGALGFGDIPVKAFAKAMDLIAPTGVMAFNIRELFLEAGEQTPFSTFLHELSRRRVIQFQAYHRYQHRMSVAGRPLFYVAVVADKLRDLPDDLMDRWVEQHA